MIVRFVPLQESHLERIVEIEKLSNTSPWSDQSFRNEIANPRGPFLVALADGEICGFGGVWHVVDEAHVINVAVAPEQRGQGIGTRLVTRLLQDSKEAGMACATLEVRAGNRTAIGLYERLGFHEVSRRKAYYPDNREDAVVMWLYGLQEWKAA